MKCQDFRELIDSYLSDELLTETNHDLLRHLEECADCRREIQTRRNLLLQMRSAVVNSPQFQMREDFRRNLRARLQQSAKPRNVFWTSRNSWLAVAAAIVLTAGLGFWFFQTRNLPSPPIARVIENPQSAFLAVDALGDHQNCAVKFNLPEDPFEIDLSSAKYADLRNAVLMPLQNSPDRYELLESHLCKYNGRTFTHIVFQHRGKTVSVLLTDLQNYPTLKDEEIISLAASGYQLARFDAKNRAIFVVSDLSPEENMATAKILMNPVRQNLDNSAQAKLALFTEP
ncbi:MAG: anti-sigma factor family protein [Pyrinomonadaceae bacterium]